MDYIEVSFELDPILPAREVLIYELGELGFESFVNSESGFTAYIQEPLFEKDQLNSLTGLKIEELRSDFQIKKIKDQNWNAEWESSFEPVMVEDKLVIRAPFHQLEAKFQEEVLISPQMSFGTGHHATTFLMSNELLNSTIEGKNVLDMGCGTAVLAILAEKLGAKAVHAIDIDEWSYKNALQNLELNDSKKIHVEMGDAERLGNQTYQLILANINKNILLQDIEVYSSVLESGGSLWLSGFFSTDVKDLLEHSEKFGLKFATQREKDAWALLCLTKI